MFDDKLARARKLIEQRDQIDEELRTLFGENAKPPRARRRGENGPLVDPAEHPIPAPVTNET